MTAWKPHCDTAGHVDELTLVDQFSTPESNTVAGVLQRRVEKPAFLPDSTGITSLVMLEPKFTFRRFAGRECAD